MSDIIECNEWEQTVFNLSLSIIHRIVDEIYWSQINGVRYRTFTSHSRCLLIWLPFQKSLRVRLQFSYMHKSLELKKNLFWHIEGADSGIVNLKMPYHWQHTQEIKKKGAFWGFYVFLSTSIYSFQNFNFDGSSSSSFDKEFVEKFCSYNVLFLIADVIL